MQSLDHRRMRARRAHDMQCMEEFADELRIVPFDDDIHVRYQEHILLDVIRSRLERHSAPSRQYEYQMRDEVALQLVTVRAASIETAVRADLRHQCEDIGQSDARIRRLDRIDAEVLEQRRPHEALGEEFEIAFRSQRSATRRAGH